MTGVRGIAQSYLRDVKSSGPYDIMAICPFHSKADGSSEKKGSFSMSLQTGLWYCHSCHEKGNLWKFLFRMGLDGDLIRRRYGDLLHEVHSRIEPQADPLKPRCAVTVVEGEAEPLKESWLGLFDHCPLLLLEEGFPEELLQEFDIGFDQRNNRITFPLRDENGLLWGISGRAVLENQVPRYKIYDKEYVEWGLPARTTEKRRLLWNSHRVFRQLRKDPGDRHVVLVEGFKACMRVAQAGLNCVAALGSYVSSEQLWILQRMGATVHLFFDNNEAGWSGAAKVAPIMAASLPLKIVMYPDDREQPSDLTPEEVVSAFLDAPDYTSWYLQNIV